MAWEEVISGEIIDVRDGTHDSPKYVDSGYPLITSKNLNNGQINFEPVSYISEEDYHKINKRSQVHIGDLLYSMIGTVGSMARVKEEPNYAIKNVALFKFSDHKLNSDYFYYLMQSKIIERQINKQQKGGTQKFVSLKILRNLKIPLPPLRIQKKIAAILDAADNYRQKTKALIDKYDQLTQSIFLDMFGDPVRNEKGWEVVKFSEMGLCERGKSKHRPRNAPELLGGDYPLIQTGDIANADDYILKYNSTYSELGLKQSRIWEKGTLCITIAANIAKTGILTFDSCFPDSIVGFTPNENSNSIFIQSWMSFLQKIIEDKAPESAQKNINLAILRDLDIIKPPIELQNKFKQRIEFLSKNKTILKGEIDKSETLFQSLLQKAFKGELIK